MAIINRSFNKRQRLERRQRNPKLFTQFAHQSSVWLFARFNFAARKFPQARHAAARWSLLDEHPARHIEQCDGNDQQQRLRLAQFTRF
jgi:hypothetical protein